MGRLLVFALAAYVGLGQSAEPSPDELIRAILSPRQDDRPPEMGFLVSCGWDARAAESHRKPAVALVKLGQRALPAVKQTIQTLAAASGEPEPAAIDSMYWLALAYAKLDGDGCSRRADRSVTGSY
jgi:hypothetical protein